MNTNSLYNDDGLVFLAGDAVSLDVERNGGQDRRHSGQENKNEYNPAELVLKFQEFPRGLFVFLSKIFWPFRVVSKGSV